MKLDFFFLLHRFILHTQVPLDSERKIRKTTQRQQYKDIVVCCVWRNGLSQLTDIKFYLKPKFKAETLLVTNIWLGLHIGGSSDFSECHLKLLYFCFPVTAKQMCWNYIMDLSFLMPIVYIWNLYAGIFFWSCNLQPWCWTSLSQRWYVFMWSKYIHLFFPLGHA